MRRRATEIIEADNRRDIERVMRSYTADAVLIPPDAREVIGQQNIRPRYKTLFDENLPDLRTTIELPRSLAYEIPRRYSSAPASNLPNTREPL